VLHCNGNLGEMVAVANEAPELKGDAARRADAALAARRAPEEFDTEVARRLFTQMIDERTEFQRKIGS
jgi:beta-N-acetylhexosaminidase